MVEGIAGVREFAIQSDDPVAINVKREAFNRMTIPLAEAAMTASLCVDDAATTKDGKTEQEKPSASPSSTSA